MMLTMLMTCNDARGYIPSATNGLRQGSVHSPRSRDRLHSEANEIDHVVELHITMATVDTAHEKLSLPL